MNEIISVTYLAEASGFYAATNVALKMLDSFTSACVDAGAASVQLAVNFERSITAFEVFTGAASTARQLMMDMKQLAIETPFRFSGLQEAGTILLGFGQSGQTLIPTLARLGDIAAGDEGHLRRLSLAFGEVISEGRLTGVRARQFAQLGVGFPEFARTMGVSTREFRELMREGSVGVEVVIETLNRLTNAGGRFYQMSERQNLTVLGQWNALRETIEYILERIGVGLFQSLDVAGRIGQIREFVRSFDVAKIVEFFTEVGKTVDYIIVSARTLGPVLTKAFEIMIGENSLGTWKEFQDTSRSFFKELTILIAQGANEMSILVLEARQFIQIVKNLASSPFGRATISSMFGFASLFGNKEVSKFISGAAGGILGGGSALGASGAFLSGEFGDPTIQADIDKLRGDRDKIRGRISQQFADMEMFDKVSRAFRKMFPGGPARPEIPILPTISGDAQKAATDLIQTFKNGVTPLDKYRHGLELLNQAFFGVIAEKPHNPLGAVAGGLASVYAIPTLTREQFEAGGMALYEQLKQATGLGKEAELPKAALSGSAEAVDIINRGQQEALSIQEEVAQVLRRSEEIQKEHKDRTDAVYQEIKKREAFGIIIKGVK